MALTRLMASAVALLAIVAGGTVVLRSRGDEGAHRPQSAAVVATARAAASRATTTAPPTPTAARGRFVVSEFRGSETLLLSVSALNPTDRRPLARIEHAPNWAPRAAIAPGGDLVAYTVLPPGSRSPDSEGTLWAVALKGREPRRLAARVDLRVTPLWAPDGTRVVYQRAIAGGTEGAVTALEEVDVRDGKAQELATAPPSRLLPVGYAPDAARFYYVRFERDGAYLHEVDTRSRAARRVARLADGAARDFRLSPDGSVVLYLALSGSPARYRAMTMNIGTGDVRPVLPGVSRSEDVGVAWRPGTPAAATVGMVGGGGEATGRVLVEGEATPVLETARGFDVPVAWSPDGRMLLVRSFSGTSADNPGAEQPVLVDSEGGRKPVTGEGRWEFVGWVIDAP
jgi:dipeptidyl aminopeptidase/acylaminoacyl peptidase